MEKEYTFDTAVLYSSFDSPEYRRDLERVRQMTAAARQAAEAPFDEAAANWPDALFDAFARMDEVLRVLSNMLAYATILQLADVTDTRAKEEREALAGTKQALDLLGVDIGEKVCAIGDMARVAADARAEQYGYYFKRQQAELAHTPPRAVNEAMLSMQRNGGHAWQRLRGEVSAAPRAALELDGEVREMSLPTLRGYQGDARAPVRKAAFEAEMVATKPIEDTMAACLNAIKGEAITVAGLKKFDSVLDWMLHVNHMNAETLGVMNAAIVRNLPAMQNYLKAKAALLGHKNGLPYYDLYAPVGQGARGYTFGDARALLTDVFTGVDPEMGDFIQNAFDQGWIDAEPRPDKQGGGICIPLPDKAESRVMLTFSGHLSDVAIIAHELGHAFHDRCTHHIPMLLLDAPTPVCETASTFNETLVYEAALAGAKDDEKLFLLDELLAGATRNIVDIYSRFLFEDEVFKRRAKTILSPGEISGLMVDSQKTTYGDALDPAWVHPYMWISKVHYYICNYHYYNFPYAFGLLFSQGLYAIYRQDPKGFYQRYKALLAGTCSATVEDIAAMAGISLASPRFWDDAFSSFREKSELFVKLANKAIEDKER